MQIAILGSSGFIGSHLSQNLKSSIGVSLRDQDWEKKAKCADVWINLVGKAHDHKGDATELDYRNINVELLKQVYETFVESDAKLFIHISSIAALEEFTSIDELTEEDSCRPVSWYGKSKREAEEWLMMQELPEGKKMIIIRPPMVHGPGEKGNLGLLYKLISKGIPYPLSSFNNSRAFIAIDNFCYFMDNIVGNYKYLDSGIYHIADDESISTKEIISIIKKVTNRNVIDLALPKGLVKLIAKFGDIIPIPLNSKRLQKMTSDLLVSNQKIKTVLGIDKLPLTAAQGIEKTIKSFSVEK